MIKNDHATPDGGAKFGAFADSGLDGDSLFRSAGSDADTTEPSSSTDETEKPKRKSRRRGGRRKSTASKADADADEASTDDGARRDSGRATFEDLPQDADGDEAPARKKRRRSRRRPAKQDADSGATDQAESPSAESGDEADSGDTGNGRSRRAVKSRRGGRRGSRRDRDADDTDTDDAAPAEVTSADERGADDATGEDGEPRKKRRRRGTRGGRKRKKKDTDVASGEGPAVIEAIPGEEDDLPELPDLPVETELLDESEEDTGRGRRKKRGRSTATKSTGSRKKSKSRSRSRSEDDEDDDEGLDAELDEPRAKRGKAAAVKRTQRILVNANDREETRVAVVEGERLIDLQINAATDQNLVSDVYRGRVVNIEASIGAAFIDFGRGRNGFLHTSDVLPDYGEKGWKLENLLSTHIDPEEWDELSSQPHIAAEVSLEDDDDELDDDSEDGDDKGKRGKGKQAAKKKRGKQKSERPRRRPRTPITELLKVGQRVVVQVTKDAIGDKGPTLTTYLSIPGRYLVLMPSMQHTGVSRKIEDPKERKRLKRALDTFAPKGMGVIARTAASGRTKIELKRDLEYLLGAWEHFSEKLSVGNGPTALYQESDVAIKTVRDLFGPTTESVVVDNKEAYDSIREFAERLMPDQVERIQLHDGKRPIFHHYGVEQDYEKIFSRRLELPSGGSIVIDQAEALVAIDVNSGKTRTDSFDFEEIALKTNLEAVPEIARQIRLRDLGGILVIDFIDMMRRSNMRLVERAFRDAFAGDRARSKLGRISQFGLLEMTRQRLGPGIGKRLFTTCQHCRGLGKTRTVQSRATAILRRLGSSLTLKGFSQVEVRAHSDAIQYLKEHHADDLNALEANHSRTLKLTEVPDQLEDSVLRYLRADGREVRPGGRRKR